MMGKSGCVVCSGGGWDGRLGLVNNLDGWGKRRRADGLTTDAADGRAARVNNDCRERGHVTRFLFSVGRLVAVGRRVERLAPLRASQAARASSAPSGGDETRREGKERSPRDRPRGGWANEDFPTKIIVSRCRHKRTTRRRRFKFTMDRDTNYPLGGDRRSCVLQVEIVIHSMLNNQLESIELQREKQVQPHGEVDCTHPIPLSPSAEHDP